MKLAARALRYRPVHSVSSAPTVHRQDRRDRHPGALFGDHGAAWSERVAGLMRHPWTSKLEDPRRPVSSRPHRAGR